MVSLSPYLTNAPLGDDAYLDPTSIGPGSISSRQRNVTSDGLAPDDVNWLNTYRPLETTMTPTGMDLRGLHIVAAEDEGIFQTFLQRIFGELGFTIKLASNGRDMLALLGSDSPSIVLLDCKMPQLDGYETARAIRLQEGLRGREHSAPLPVFIAAFTVEHSDASREKAFHAGMNAFIAKPANKEILARTVLKGLSWLSYKRTYPFGRMESDQEYDKVLDKVAQLRADIGAEAAADLIGEFLATTPERFEELRQAIRLKDGANLRRISHSYKSVCQIFGLESLSERCKQLEDLAQVSDFDQSIPLLRDIEESFQAMRELLAQQAKLLP